MQEVQKQSLSLDLVSKLRDYVQLVKFTLSFTVVFSCVVCYLLVPVISFNLLSVLLLFAGGMLITGSANAINQVVEKDTDASALGAADGLGGAHCCSGGATMSPFA